MFLFTGNSKTNGWPTSFTNQLSGTKLQKYSGWLFIKENGTIKLSHLNINFTWKFWLIFAFYFGWRYFNKSEVNWRRNSVLKTSKPFGIWAALWKYSNKTDQPSLATDYATHWVYRLQRSHYRILLIAGLETTPPTAAVLFETRVFSAQKKMYSPGGTSVFWFPSTGTLLWPHESLSENSFGLWIRALNQLPTAWMQKFMPIAPPAVCGWYDGFPPLFRRRTAL